MVEPLSKVRNLPMVIAAVTGAIIYWGVVYFLSSIRELGFVSWPFLVFAPVAAPILAVLLLDPRGRLPSGEHFKLGATVIFALILGSFLFLREGGICIVMLAPLYLGGGVGGAIVMGRLLRWRSGRALSSILVTLPLLAMPFDEPALRPSHTETVISVAEIAAPPEAVWKNTVAVADIKPSELGWTFTQSVIGVPKPLDAWLEGTGVGAVRHVTWERGVHFQERITAWRQSRLLTWDFQFSPDSIPPEIDRHMSPDSSYLKVRSGGYELTPLPNGHTRVTLHTSYSERTALNGYCAWWGRIFIGDFHRNVLRVIRERSESAI